MSGRTKKMVFCAMSIALATAASLIRIFSFPFGGSVTLCSMLFIFLPAWIYGLREGLISGLIYGMLQFVTQPYFITLPQFLFDYVFAFTIMGLGAFFRNRRHGLTEGYLIAVLGRWIMATIAGLIWVSLGSRAWDRWAPLPYSMIYNGCYIFTEAAVTVILVSIPAVRAALDRVRNEALAGT